MRRVIASLTNMMLSLSVIGCADLLGTDGLDVRVIADLDQAENRVSS